MPGLSLTYYLLLIIYYLDNVESSDYIFGIHSAIEAIESGRTVDKLLVKKDLNGDMAQRLLKLAKAHMIPVQRVPVEEPSGRSGFP